MMEALEVLEQDIEKVNNKINVIEMTLEAYTDALASTSVTWDNFRKGKVGALYAYSSLDDLIEEKKQLREKEKQLREEKNLLLAQKASNAAHLRPPSPSYPHSIFVLCDLNGMPCGTAFAVAKNYLLTAKHNLVRGIIEYKIVDTLTRHEKTGEILNSGFIKVKAIRCGKVLDWAILETVEFDSLVHIPLTLREVNRDTDIKIYHCPVQLFNNFDIEILCPNSRWTKVMATVGHSLFADGGLFKGSSGGPFILRDGCAVGFHVESISESKTTESNFIGMLRQDQKLANNDALWQSIEVLTETIDSNCSVHDSVCKALSLRKLKNLTDNLCNLGIEFH